MCKSEFAEDRAILQPHLPGEELRQSQNRARKSTLSFISNLFVLIPLNTIISYFSRIMRNIHHVEQQICCNNHQFSNSNHLQNQIDYQKGISLINHHTQTLGEQVVGLIGLCIAYGNHCGNISLDILGINRKYNYSDDTVSSIIFFSTKSEFPHQVTVLPSRFVYFMAQIS